MYLYQKNKKNIKMFTFAVFGYKQKSLLHTFSPLLTLKNSKLENILSNDCETRSQEIKNVF